MKRIITIIALAAAAAASQAQVVFLDGLMLTAATPLTVHAEGDTVTMLWRAVDTSNSDNIFDVRLAVTGCTAGKGRIAVGSGGHVPWTWGGKLQTDVIARATCVAGGRLS